VVLGRVLEKHFLGMHGKRPPLSFLELPSLGTVSIDWHARDSGLSELRTVKKFFLWHHKPKDKSFVGTAFPPCADHAQINWTNAPSLQGLSGLQGVRKFEVHRSKNLESLNGIEVLADSLEELIVDTCSKLKDLDALGSLPKLKLAVVNARDVISR
jgi:hypothetical protein